MDKIDQFVARLDQLLDKVERMLPAQTQAIDWAAPAFRVKLQQGACVLQAVTRPHRVDLASLQNIETQKQSLLQNTQQFAQGRPANNVLLTGARGTGKSTLIKACWNAVSEQGVKIIEVDKADLAALPDLLELLSGRAEKFIIFCDDLSFEGGEISYKALKSALDGSISAPSDNMVFYATSNRRHLIAQTMKENLDVSYEDGELRPGDTVEEKVSLSERFGLWLSFYPFSQDEYLAAARYWIEYFGGNWTDLVSSEALLWHRTRGARSGRIAWQFARDYAGRKGADL